MTETEWKTARHAEALLRFIEPRTSDRKLHYFAIACARRIAPLLPCPDSLHGVDVLERYVEGQCAADELSEVRWYVQAAAYAAEYGKVPWFHAIEHLPVSLLTELAANPDDAVDSLSDLLSSAAYFVDAIVRPAPWERRSRDWPHNSTGSLFLPVPLVHEIFGNPFHTVAFRRHWRTDTVLALARGMYESRDYSAMPVLADALQDAGCEDDEVLSHCREPGPHVRGCWLVDRVLCKK